MKYLCGIVNETVFCPKKTKIQRYKQKTRYGTKFLTSFLKDYMEKNKFNIGVNSYHLPNKKWVLDVLNTVCPNCYFLANNNTLKE